MPLITKGDVTECVVCEGTGTGEDGAYEDMHPHDRMRETASYKMKKQRFLNITSSFRRVNFDVDYDVASREVGRRMLSGWQLLESPCLTCHLPVLSETMGGPEVCVFCDPDDDIEIADEEEEEEEGDVPDDHSYSSRRSVTIELPDNFNPNDPYAMAQLVAQAAAASSGQSVMSRSSRRSRTHGRPQNRGPERPNSRPKPQPYGSSNRPSIPPGGRMTPTRPGRQMNRKLPQRPPNRIRSQSPRPESRGSYSSARGGNSRNRNRSRSRNPEGRNPEGNREPMYVSTGNRDEDEDHDDADSDISDNLSVAKTVASTTLDAIMSKINDCKHTLSAPIDHNDVGSVARKGEAAALMQKLAAAAAAVKHLN